MKEEDKIIGGVVAILHLRGVWQKNEAHSCDGCQLQGDIDMLDCWTENIFQKYQSNNFKGDGGKKPHFEEYLQARFPPTYPNHPSPSSPCS